MDGHENLGNFACLGWGSLIWEPGDLPILHEWRKDGPNLPLEFARKSLDGRMTIVVCKQGTLCQTLWNTLSSTSLEEARKTLAKREGLPSSKNAAFWSDTGASEHHGTELVGAWAKKRGFAGVVWTGLPPKSPATDLNNDHPSIGDVLLHLSGLQGHSASRAEEYVRKAPNQIATAYRTCITKEFGWHGQNET
jgi:cation transport regulator ChaC